MLKKLTALKLNKNRGFTLIELIVVIAILGVLIAILVPSMIGFLDSARMVSVKAEAKTILNGGQALAGEEVMINNVAITNPQSQITIEKMGNANLLDANSLDGGQLTEMTISSDGVTITHFKWTHNGYQAVYDIANNPQWVCSKVGGGAGGAGGNGNQNPGGDNANKGPGNNNGQGGTNENAGPGNNSGNGNTNPGGKNP